MLNNKPGQASRKLAQTTHTHTQEQQQNAITCTAYFGAGSGAGAGAGSKLPRQPQKAQRFIRFALLLSVKLFRKLFATENAKQINTATAAEVVLPLSPLPLCFSLLTRNYFSFVIICIEQTSRRRRPAAL